MYLPDDDDVALCIDGVSLFSHWWCCPPMTLCTAFYSIKYLNLPEVQMAMHANASGSMEYPWVVWTFSRGRGENPNLKMNFLLACICWSIWLIRNDYVFNNELHPVLMLWCTGHLFSCRNGAHFSRRRKKNGLWRRWKNYQHIWSETA